VLERTQDEKGEQRGGRAVFMVVEQSSKARLARLPQSGGR
jgi:hypothetical protein